MRLALVKCLHLPETEGYRSPRGSAKCEQLCILIITDELTGHRNTKWSIPFNSVYTTSLIVGVMCLIQLGSTLAFNIIVSLSVLGLLSTYMISIGCVFLRRYKGQPLPHARWSLGRYGIWINGFAFLYSAFIIIIACWPTYLPVNLASANWAPVVWVAVMILSAIVYVLHGKHHYTAPVEFVEGRKAAGVGLQSS